MKVLHVIPSLAMVHGGPTTALLSMERVLRELGIEVETATTNDAGPGLRQAKPLGVPLHEEGAVHLYFSKATEFYKVSPTLGHWLRQSVREYDVLHLHALFTYSTNAAARAAGAAGVPYVVRPLGTLDAYGMSRRRPWLKRLSMNWVERPLLQHASAVHFTSQAEAEHARALVPGLREAVIPLGVPCPVHAPRPRVRSSGPRLLFMSRLDPKKNLEALIAAARLLLPEFPGLELAIAGEGPAGYTQALRLRVREAGLEDRTHWLGHIEAETKAAEFANADVFVLPSFSENFGIAAAEALAAGVPCVLGAGVAIADEAQRAGAAFAVAPSADEVADGVRRIISSPAARDAMALRAWRLASESFSEHAMGMSLKQLYSSILDGTDGTRSH